MADSDKTDRPAFEPTVVLDEGEILSIQIKRPKRNAEGDQVAPAKGVIAIEFDMDRLVQYVGTLARIIKRERGVTVGLRFIEQLELLARKDVADKNGTGPKPTGLEPIEGGKAGKKGRQKQPVT